MILFITRRLLYALVTVFLSAVLVFVAVQLLPGDVATQILGQNATADAVATLRDQLDLNRPVVVRFLEWLGGAVRGDFGESLVSGEPVADSLWLHLRNTSLIAAATVVVAVTTSIVLGVVAGLYRDRWPDTAISTLTLVGMSIPEFVVATLLVLVLSITVPVLPAVVLDEATVPVADLLPAVVLPTIALSVVMTAYIVRMTRTSVIDVMSSEFVSNARLKGLSAPRVVIRHALPSALIPTLNVIAMNVAWLVGGVVVVENVFNYPGLGQLLLESVHNRDLPMLQAIAVVSAVVYVLCNLAADLGSMALNPRLRAREGSVR